LKSISWHKGKKEKGRKEKESEKSCHSGITGGRRKGGERGRSKKNPFYDGQKLLVFEYY